MESQDNHHHPPEHTFREIGSAEGVVNQPGASTATAILERMRLGRPSLLHGLDETQLLAELENSEWHVRVAVIQKFEDYAEHASVDRLIKALKDEHEAVRAAAAHALGILQNPEAVTPLVEALQDPIWLVRTAVVQALGMLGEHAPVEPLMLALHDEDESVRVAAVWALAAMGRRVPVESLLIALQDSAWQVREMALFALGTSGRDIPETALTLALQDEVGSVRSAARFLQENYPDRFARIATNLPADVSEESTGATFDALIQNFPQAASQPEQKQEQRGNDLLHEDQEQHLEYGVHHRNLQRYPRRGAVFALRWVLLMCWSIFLGYLLGCILNLVQLTHADPAQFTTRVVMQTLSAPLTVLSNINAPVWVRGVCMLLVILLFMGCFWATRDAWYEHNWVRRRAASHEEAEDRSRGYNQFTPVLVDSPQQVSNSRMHSRRTVLVGLTAVLIVGNGIAWSLLLNSRLKKGSTHFALGTNLYIDDRHRGTVRSVAWSPNSTHIASGSDDNTVQVWESDSGRNFYSYSSHTSAVLTVAWSPDGSRIASAGDDGTVRIWNASTGQNILTYRGHAGDVVAAVAWSPDSTRIASTSGGGGQVQVWNAANGDLSFSYTAGNPTGGTLTVAWSPDGSRIASSGADGNVYVFDASTGRDVFVNTFGFSHGFQESDRINSVAWSPDSTRIASGSDGKTVQVWDASNGEQVYTYRGHSNNPLGFVKSVAWSPDGTRIASGSEDKTVQVWDATDGKNAYIYRRHTDFVNTVAWSPDGTRIASGSNDRTVHIWGAELL
jgi:HEAT repeat protein/Tol biopolymer transport system component